MKIQTKDLIGPALDWAVCACLGPRAYGMMKQIVDRPMSYIGKYSTDWSLGGPIIERENICIRGIKPGFECWLPNTPHKGYGPTQLIAAMRCYVASRLEEEIEVPVALVK